MVTLNISVKGGANITIKPGVRLEFQSGTTMSISDDGSLKAVGPDEEPIVLLAPCNRQATGMDLVFTLPINQ